MARPADPLEDKPPREKTQGTRLHYVGERKKAVYIALCN